MAYSDNNAKDRSSMKSFESFRIYLKKVCQYCSLGPSDFNELDVNISKTKYNDYKNKAKSLSIDKLKENKLGNRKKALGYNVNQFESSYNFLSDAYYFKTLTANKVNMLLYILTGISLNGGMTQKDIAVFFADSFDDNKEPDEKNMKKIIKNCKESGVIYKDEKRKYHISEIDENITSEKNLPVFLNFVDFMKDIIYPNVLGYYLFEDLKHIYKVKTGKDYQSPFQMKNQYVSNILDEEVLWKIITSKIEKKYISFEYKNKTYKKINAVKIVVEKQKHRMYLFAYCPNDSSRREKVFRLDMIYKIEILSETTEEDEEVLEQKYFECTKNAFMGIPVTSKKSDETTFSFEFEKTLKNEIKESFPAAEFSGNVVKVTVSDMQTVIPWFKAHMGFVKNIDNKELSDIIDEEIREMQKLYGII